MLEISTLSKSDNDPLKSVRDELKDFLDSYHNESAALASFERYSGLNRKTLKGFLNLNRRPYPDTLISFYKWVYKTDDVQIIARSLRPEVVRYLALNGINIQVEEKDLLNVISKTTIHYEIYMMTEDYQIIKKDQVTEIFGKRGLDAINDLLMEGLLQAIDENSFTSGQIRCKQDVNYYKTTTELASQIFPWEEIQKDPMFTGAGLSIGNIVISKNDEIELNRAFYDLKKKLCDLHEKGVKETSTERLRYIYSTMVFRPEIERGI